MGFAGMELAAAPSPRFSRSHQRFAAPPWPLAILTAVRGKLAVTRALHHRSRRVTRPPSPAADAQSSCSPEALLLHCELTP